MWLVQFSLNEFGGVLVDSSFSSFYPAYMLTLTIILSLSLSLSISQTLSQQSRIINTAVPVRGDLCAHLLKASSSQSLWVFHLWRLIAASS